MFLSQPKTWCSNKTTVYPIPAHYHAFINTHQYIFLSTQKNTQIFQSATSAFLRTSPASTYWSPASVLRRVVPRSAGVQWSWAAPEGFRDRSPGEIKWWDIDIKSHDYVLSAQSIMYIIYIYIWGVRLFYQLNQCVVQFLCLSCLVFVPSRSSS